MPVSECPYLNMYKMTRSEYLDSRRCDTGDGGYCSS